MYPSLCTLAALPCARALPPHYPHLSFRRHHVRLQAPPFSPRVCFSRRTLPSRRPSADCRSTNCMLQGTSALMTLCPTGPRTRLEFIGLCPLGLESLRFFTQREEQCQLLRCPVWLGDRTINCNLKSQNSSLCDCRISSLLSVFLLNCALFDLVVLS